MKEKIKLAVLISGGGRTLLNFCDQIDSGKLKAHVDVVVSSRTNAKGVQRAKERGLTTVVVDRKSTPTPAFHDTITRVVSNVDLVCMSGFLSLWHIPKSFEGRVINIHPALLPEFGGKGMYGLRVHQAVIDAGRTESGCTVHYCDNEYDHGPIILQRKVPVHPGDTPRDLADRVFQEECFTYPEAVEMIRTGKSCL